MSQLDLFKARRCACGNLRMTSRALTQLYDRQLQPSGLRTTQFSVLVTIARLGPISVTQLAEALLMDQTTVTRNLNPLEKNGWLRRNPTSDQRRRLLELTEAGQQVLELAYPLWEQAQSKIIADFGPERFQALLKELAALNALT